MSTLEIPVVVPGTVLGDRKNLIPGDGTYCINEVIFASVTGVCSINPSQEDPSKVRPTLFEFAFLLRHISFTTLVTIPSLCVDISCFILITDASFHPSPKTNQQYS